MDDTSRMARGKLVAGLIVIALGLLFLLDALRVVEAGSVWRFWPVLIIVHGISRLAEPVSERRPRSGLFEVLIGFWLLGNTLGLLEWETSWPLVLVAVGLSIVWRELLSGAPAQKRGDEDDESLSPDDSRGLL